MELIINGEATELPAPLNIQELLRLLELKDDAVAVEVNRRIIRRDSWEATALQNNDRLEIVHFVGGG